MPFHFDKNYAQFRILIEMKRLISRRKIRILEKTE